MSERARRELPPALREILQVQEMQGEWLVNRIRLVYSVISVLLFLGIWQINTHEANVVFGIQVGSWLTFAVGWELLRRYLERQHGPDHYVPALKYISITVDLGLLTLGAYANSMNHSGIIEYFRSYIPLVYVFWNLLSGLRLSSVACLYSAGLSLSLNLLVLSLTVSTGIIEISQVAVYDRNAINLSDQGVEILFIAVPGLIAAGLVRIMRRLILRSEAESMRRARLEAERERLGKYLSKDIVELVVNEGEALQLGGARRQATVLFSDIRNFTPLAETIEPEAAVNMLNDYFTRMVDIVFRYGGTLDKFMGDGMMVVFGAPLPLDDAPTRAVCAALEMCHEMEQFNERLREQGFPAAVSIGIGVATGPVVAGNIGSPERMEYTCIGDTVNYAARLESANKALDSNIAISESTWAALSTAIPGEQVEPMQLKGKRKAVQPYVIDPAAVSPERLAEVRAGLLESAA
ncbi:MAG: adenylate/guanylate cyclase domain-containing protein [Alphaproteobacteria bacterium]|nr:adenylate/guanylate cyclase domain-containing protein [Alphaproteobacteria bacterium]